MHEVSKNIFFLPLYLFMWVHIKDTIVLKVDILCGKKWKSCRHSQPSCVRLSLWQQDDSEDSETDGDEEDGSQSSTNLQAASRFHR